jgi:hypothetical protein
LTGYRAPVPAKILLVDRWLSRLNVLAGFLCGNPKSAMKIKFPSPAAVILLASAGLALGTTINFDNLAATAVGGTHANIANGYSGLNWNNFAVIDGADSPNSGYQAGTVSSKNAAFNGSGASASFSGAAFNLNSGNFAAAWNDNLMLEVKGYVGSTLTYDNTYFLSAVSSTLITFNFVDVDQVSFFSSGGTQDINYAYTGTQFVMDNLTITATVPDAGSSALMLGAALTSLGWLRMKLTPAG